jgi:hypothetical protein
MARRSIRPSRRVLRRTSSINRDPLEQVWPVGDLEISMPPLAPFCASTGNQNEGMYKNLEEMQPQLDFL